MAKHRKKQQWKQKKLDIMNVSATSFKEGKTEKDRYTLAIENGRELEEYIVNKKGQNVLPKRSIGRSKSMPKLSG